MSTAALLLSGLVALACAVVAPGCARVEKLSFVDPVARVVPDEIVAAEDSAQRASGVGATPADRPADALRAMFADTLIGFVPGTADSARRYLGRLRSGYVVDTLNVVVMGDNRPSYRSSRLRPNTTAIRNIATLNPVNWIKGIVNIPILLVKGTIPDFALWRDIPSLITKSPSYGRETQVMKAILARADSLEGAGKEIAAVINSGDLVKDGRYAAHWERFLTITRPLYERVPYFPIAGNHERTDDSTGLANWHTATGLPIKSNLLHYCFDSTDGWVRFIALDSNPMTDPKHYWSREDEIAATNEQITWMIARLKEHKGPALVFMHHPPFCLGFHRTEWESDSVLYNRRLEMVDALREAGLSVMAAGHEHAYERALLTCGESVLICLVAGGAGSPLHAVATGQQAASMFAAYDIPGCEFKPENVFASVSFHYVLLRFWYGGGDLHTYAVDQNGDDTLIDHIQIDLKRFGVPKIDQQKMPIPTEGPAQPPPAEETAAGRVTASSDSAKTVKPVTAPSSKPSSGTRR
ncbi:MAG: metallophosphoesterase family protein [Candidatus Eiseniibacteriota bacterium]